MRLKMYKDISSMTLELTFHMFLSVFAMLVHSHNIFVQQFQVHSVVSHVTLSSQELNSKKNRADFIV